MTEHQRIIFSGMQVLLDQRFVADKAIVVENQRITNIIHKEMVHNHLPAQHYQYPHDHFLIPGLVDLHIHGTHGRDVMDATPESLLAIRRTLPQDGVTGFLATTMSASNERITAALKNIAAVMPLQDGATILGAHLEGPFIAKGQCGAQCADHIIPVNLDLMTNWQHAANNAIKIVTLAPELEGADRLMGWLRNMDIVISLGHTQADYAETLHAIQYGAEQATHLFNAMGQMQQRAPGALTALLLSEKIVAELIVDGVHVHPAIVELAYRVKGKEGLVLVTDAMRAKCLGDGEYELGGQTVNVVAGQARLNNGAIAGSTLRLPQAIKNMMSYTHCSFAEAVQMASENPIQSLGLSQRKGSIAVGKDADLVVVDSALNVHLTLCEGRVAYKTERVS